MKERFTNFSVWRFKNGTQTLVDALVNTLNKYEDVKFNLNEKCLNIDLSRNLSKINVQTDKNAYDVDLVISSVYSKCNLFHRLSII